MKIAVNLTWMTPGRVGGSEAYLTRQLLGLDPDGFDVELFVDPSFPDAHPALVDRFETTAMPTSGNRRAARIGLEHTWLAVRARGADVVHHGGGTAPVLGPRPFVLTVHDLQYRSFPQYFSPARRRYLELLMPGSVGRARVITVPTETVRRDVVESFGTAPERVVVVPHGVPDAAVPEPERIADTRARYGIRDRPYVTYPAITHPHKAHVVLVEMLDHLRDDTMLVLIGGEGAAEPELATAIASSGHADRILRPGRVSDADRDALLAGAEALVFPSEFEGFGAPVIEAMTLGTPVVASAAPALVEVVGGAGVIVSEATGAAWADAVTSARANAAELIALGRTRRGDFTIEASGRAIGAVWREATS